MMHTNMAYLVTSLTFDNLIQFLKQRSACYHTAAVRKAFTNPQTQVHIIIWPVRQTTQPKYIVNITV